jgi:hypothetical protein
MRVRIATVYNPAGQTQIPDYSEGEIWFVTANRKQDAGDGVKHIARRLHQHHQRAISMITTISGAALASSLNPRRIARAGNSTPSVARRTLR